MRGGMPSPPSVSAVSVPLIPVPSRRRPSVWLSPLVVGLTVALAGAATGYSASHLRKAGVVNVDRSPAIVRSLRPKGAPAAPAQPAAALLVMPVRRVKGARADPLARMLNDPILRPLSVRGRKPMPLTVIVDGRVQQITSTFRTPVQVLEDMRITVRPADRVVPRPHTPLWSGAKVRVIRIQREVATKPVLLPVPLIRRQDPTLPRGRVAVTPGRPGVKVQRVIQTFADEKLVSQAFLDQQVVRQSQPRVIRTGTKVLIASRGAFAGREFLDVVATAYAPWCCRGVDSITAIGLRAGYGVVAVDPRVIPLRSKLYIEGYGYAIAGDTGSAIKGLRIDLGMDTIRLAKQFGRRSVRVYIIEKAPPKTRKK